MQVGTLHNEIQYPVEFPSNGIRGYDVAQIGLISSIFVRQFKARVIVTPLIMYLIYNLQLPKNRYT